jgi:hypothetical protein
VEILVSGLEMISGDGDVRVGRKLMTQGERTKPR